MATGLGEGFMDNCVTYLIEHARGRGFGLLPVDMDKHPLTKSWKEFQVARASEAQIEQWLRIDPPAWAIITGAVSGIVVLDFDGDRGNATMGALGLNPHVRSGGGGHHVYFQHPGWPVSSVNSKSKQALGEKYPGLDVRADGGYCVFAGRNRSGEYEWLRDMVPDPQELLPD